MRERLRGNGPVVFALALAVAASAVWLFLPMATYVEAERVAPRDPGRPPETIVRTGRTTLLENEENDAAVIAAIAFPVVVAAAPLAFRARRASRLSRIGAAALLGVFSLVAAASVGLFYLPSAIAMTLAAVPSR